MAINKEKVMDGARKLAEKNQLEKAVKEYLRVVQEDPKDLRVWLKIGDLHIKRGSKQDATEVYLKVAKVYQEQGFLQKAVAVYKQVLKIDPHLVDVNLRLAELFRQLGLLGDAMQHFEAVAGHFHRDGNTKEALATVRQLVELDPENVATRIKLAELYSKESLTAEAIAEFTLATAQLRKQGRQDDFIKVSERLLWHQPENIDLSRELAGLYLRKNDARRALQKLQTCFKADARNVETLAMLAQAFQALEQTAKTVSVLKELAKVHDENKHSAKADDVFRKILEFEPRDADALARLAGKKPAGVAPGARAVTPPPAAPVGAVQPPRIAPPRAPTPVPADRPRLTFTHAAPPANSRMTGAIPLIDDAPFALTPAPSLRDQLNEDSSYRDGTAAGERHADEIAKTLGETDVYLKYGLHQKAIDHLRRVFALDADNFEARERLKDVYLAQGREADALVELVRLAEASAPVDPQRALVYVREALALDAGHRPSLELVRRHRLPLESETGSHTGDMSSGAIALVDDDDGFDDLAFAPNARQGSRGVPRNASIGDDDDFDPQDLIAPRAVPQGSPAPGRPPAAAGYTPAYNEDDDFALEDVAELSAETRQVSAEAVQALAHQTLNTDDLEFDPRATAPVAGHQAVGWQGNAPAWKGTGESSRRLSAQLDAQLDDAALGDEIDHEVAAEMREAAGYPVEAVESFEDDLPFDPAAARAFDGDPYAAEVDGATAFAGDAYAAEAQAMHEADAEAEFALPDELPQEAVLAAPPANLEDELDEAEFYVTQSMFDQAREILLGLRARYPNHRMVTAKLAELERIETGDDVGAPVDTSGELTSAAVMPAGTQSIDIDFTGGAIHAAPMADDAAPRHADGDAGTQAIDLDELEELDAEFDGEAEFDPEAEQADAGAGLDAHSADQSLDDLGAGALLDDFHGGTTGGGKPAVMLERPVDEGDADTHYDLGQAYKEMGLYDAAIQAFDKAAHNPSREVQARLMLGLCHREQGNAAAAMVQFKLALRVPAMTERERQSLNYELGITAESTGDGATATYFLEQVVAQDPTFLDAAARLRKLTSGGGHGSAGGGDTSDDGLARGL